jgi:hypothetical protein
MEVEVEAEDGETEGGAGLMGRRPAWLLGGAAGCCTVTVARALLKQFQLGRPDFTTTNLH